MSILRRITHTHHSDRPHRSHRSNERAAQQAMSGALGAEAQHELLVLQTVGATNR